MFAAVYFKGDRKFDTINCKKIKGLDEKTVSNFEIEDRVKVPYKTRTLDDAGRERDEYVNFEGVITFLDKGTFIPTYILNKYLINW